MGLSLPLKKKTNNISKAMEAKFEARKLYRLEKKIVKLVEEWEEAMRKHDLAAITKVRGKILKLESEAKTELQKIYLRDEIIKESIRKAKTTKI